MINFEIHVTEIYNFITPKAKMLHEILKQTLIHSVTDQLLCNNVYSNPVHPTEVRHLSQFICNNNTNVEQTRTPKGKR